ncbi:prephenate dehydratase [Roseivirga sp. BDSF3-8]|uniref:prephenate dehydratase n=1 Tax=Roseivirga sp. BDSF3-8 TaxID=3241598 RepID=UPI003532162E
MTDLDSLRKEIDTLDSQLLELLNQRMEVVRKVGEFKKVNRAVIYRPEREKAILDRLTSLNHGLLNRQAIEAIFLEIFAVSRNIELPEKISYLGPEGSFTHQAAESRFGAMSEYLPVETISSVFDMVETGRARFGVVPIENNREGVVTETFECLTRTDLNIVAEIPLPIHFSFSTLAEKVQDIRRIYSKDIAFRQCSKFLKETYGINKVDLIPVDSTSKAAHMAAREPDSAAICSHIAARQQNLPLLFENIEDSSDNMTRFLIIARDVINKMGDSDKSTILARLGDEPGSLASFLKDFHDNGVNLTRIESRPARKGKSFKYWFFIDLVGHFEQDNVKKVLDKYRKHVKILGSYVRLV